MTNGKDATDLSNTPDAVEETPVSPGSTLVRKALVFGGAALGLLAAGIFLSSSDEESDEAVITSGEPINIL